jgi:hypothetical protein
VNDPLKKPQKPWWTAVIGSSGAFVFASLAWVAASFGDRGDPLNQIVNRHGATIIFALAALTMASGMLAMYLDQRERRLNEADDVREDP